MGGYAPGSGISEGPHRGKESPAGYKATRRHISRCQTWRLVLDHAAEAQPRGKIAEQYCKKGTKVYLEGQLQTREYTDRDGNQRKATEVVLQRFRGELTLLESRGRGDAADADRGGGGELPTVYRGLFSVAREGLKVVPVFNMAQATLRRRSAIDRKARPWL